MARPACGKGTSTSAPRRSTRPFQRSAGNFHRFTGAQDFNTLTVAGSGPISLSWSDPLGGSGNDYDIFRLNTAGTTVAASSTNIQNGNDDPYEQMSNSTASPRIVIVKKTGAASAFSAPEHQPGAVVGRDRGADPRACGDEQHLHVRRGRHVRRLRVSQSVQHEPTSSRRSARMAPAGSFSWATAPPSRPVISRRPAGRCCRSPISRRPTACS